MGTTKQVKSAMRTLQVLRLFHEQRRPLTVMDVARSLSLPQSSTTELLHTLQREGFLNVRQWDRTYFPSIRLGLMGNWVCESIFTNHDAATLMAHLHEATGLTVILTMRNDVRLEVLDVVSGVNEVRFHTKPGDSRLITRTAMGHTLLASYDDHFIQLLVRRINAYEIRPEYHASLGELQPVLEQIRRDGYRYSEWGAVSNSAIVAALIPAQNHQDRLVIGVAGPLQVMRQEKDDIADLLKREIRALVDRIALRRESMPELTPRRRKKIGAARQR